MLTLWPPRFVVVEKRNVLPVTEPSLISDVPKRAFSMRPDRRSPCCSSVSVELTCCGPNEEVIVHVPARLDAAPDAGGVVVPAGGVPLAGVGEVEGAGGPPARVAVNVPAPRPTI